jgi:hypothetical protein
MYVLYVMQYSTSSYVKPTQRSPHRLRRCVAKSVAMSAWCSPALLCQICFVEWVWVELYHTGDCSLVACSPKTCFHEQEICTTVLLTRTSMPSSNPKMSQVDEELARVATASFWIGSKDVISYDETASTIPPFKTRHQGLYSCSSGDCAIVVSEKEKEIGVPGFPDFPAFWIGEEGGAHTRQKLTKAITKGRTKRAERKNRRMIRKAVNITPHKGNSTFNFIVAKREQRMERRREMMKRIETKRKRQKNMADISRGLASLKC